MKRILRFDRVLYEIDDETRTYRYHGRNKDWKELSSEENRKNKRHIDGYPPEHFQMEERKFLVSKSKWF